MRKRLLVSVLTVSAALLTTISISSLTYGQPSVAPIQVERVKGNLYVLRGGGPIVQVGNTGITLQAAASTLAFLTLGGVVLVDTKLTGLGQSILNALKQITDKRVTTVINTHAHDDHVGGNSELPEPVEIIAQENAARRMRSVNGRGAPTRTFKDRLTIGAGDERVELYWFGAAHTDGDTWVVFPALGVVAVGDVFAYRTVPIADTANGGDPIAYARAIQAGIDMMPNAQTVITGHYPMPQEMRDLRLYADFTADLLQSAQTAKRTGRSLNEFVSGYRTPDRFAREGYVVAPLVLRPFIESAWGRIN